MGGFTHRFNTRTTAGSAFFCAFSAIRCHVCRSTRVVVPCSRNSGGLRGRNSGGQLFRPSNSQGIKRFPRAKEAGLSAIIPCIVADYFWQPPKNVENVEILAVEKPQVRPPNYGGLLFVAELRPAARPGSWSWFLGH